MKLISVIIPCYNQGIYLEDSVSSILAQTYQRTEIIIVNDGSTDPETIQILEHFDKPGCKVLHTSNQGLPSARNTGIKQTTGEYVCCLDADDRYHPDYFTKAVTVLDADTKRRFGAIASWVQLFGESDVLWKTIGANTQGFAPFLQGTRNNIHSSTMFRRSCWEELGGFDQSMVQGYEDWDFWLRMLALGYEWYCIEEVLIYYRRQGTTMVDTADLQRPRLLEALIRKNTVFYSDNFIPMLLERDQEVRNLQQENQNLREQLQKLCEKSSRSTSQTLRHISSSIARKILPALK